jgi:predicted PurR-regulated permease PerM
MKASAIFLTILVVIAVALIAMLLAPFASALLMASVIAGALQPWQDGLARGLGGSRRLAAAALTLGLLVTALGFLTAVGAVIAQEAESGIRYLNREMAESDDHVLDRLPPRARWVVDFADRHLHVTESVDAILGAASERVEGERPAAVPAVGSALRKTTNMAVQTLIMFISLFFLLTDGPRLVAWIDRVVPLEPGEFRELVEDLRRTGAAVLFSMTATAVIQTAVAFVGYLIAGVPHAPFFGLVTLMLSPFPVVGGSLPPLAVSLLLLADGHPGSALFLAIWGVVAVGPMDHIMKPLLMRGAVELHFGVIFFALIGGLAVFGAIGLIAGPLIVVFLSVLIRFYERDFLPRLQPPPALERSGPPRLRPLRPTLRRGDRRPPG